MATAFDYDTGRHKCCGTTSGLFDASGMEFICMKLVLPSLAAITLMIAGLTVAIMPTPVLAAQSYDNCTGFIDSLPATVSTQGTWCLRHDLATSITSGQAIEIGNNNITIDCNHFKLGGLAAGSGTAANGIHADGMSNTTIRNCNIRGFFSGILLIGYYGDRPASIGDVVEDNRLDGNTSRGVVVSGDNAVIRRNIITNTGGSSSLSGGGAYGIYTVYGVDVRDNLISGVRPAGGDCNTIADAYGIYATAEIGGMISGNRIRNLQPRCGSIAYGIYSGADARLSISDNVLVTTAAWSLGLNCSSNTSRAHDNVINGFQTAITGCRDDGNSL
jgi:hypothetical protein